MTRRLASFAWTGLFALVACGSSDPQTQHSTSGGMPGTTTGPGSSMNVPGTPDPAGGTPTGDPNGQVAPPTEPPPAGGSCALDAPAFCDPFDKPSPGGRAGDLDDLNWSAARISTANNVGQGEYDAWPPTTATACGMEKTGVLPGQDMFFCAGGGTPSMHLSDAYNDGGGFTIHSHRIRQPFDFEGRTGIVAFDVDAQARLPGGHGWWLNIFIASEPIPAPYQQGGAIALYAKAGVGIEFEATPAPCGEDGTGNGVSSVYVEKDYKIVSSVHPRDANAKCFKTAEEVMNHIEIHVSQTKVEVFASDAGDPKSLRSVAIVDNLALPLTRGYVNFQHTHYNARKFTFTDPKCTDANCTEGENPDPGCTRICPVMPPYRTYHWDNIGFDGPSLPTPRAYEIADTLLTGPHTWPGAVNLGYLLQKTGMSTGPKATTITLQNVDVGGAKSALLTLNAWGFLPGDNIGYRVNGGAWHSYAHPFPQSDAGARAVAIPVELSELKAGANTLEMNSGSGMIIIANAELTID